MLPWLVEAPHLLLSVHFTPAPPSQPSCATGGFGGRGFSILLERPGIVLVGTAHVSQRSVDEVRETIERVDPAVVAVELDEGRLDAVMDRQQWEATPVTDLIRGGRAPMLLAQTVLASYQRRLAHETGVEPGAEMRAAVEAAEAGGRELALVDRDISVTLKRAWGRMGLREKARVAWELWKALLGVEEDEVDVDELLEEDVVTAMMEEVATVAPSVKEVLVDERDAYLARRIHEASAAADGPLVAVVGAGHVEGIARHLDHLEDAPPLADLETVPTRRVSVGKIVGWSLTALVAVLLVYLTWRAATTGNFSNLGWNLVEFTLLTGVPSALGAALAGGHPLSILTAFVAAPVGILHPALATGWFAGAVEAWKRTPTVKDFEGLAELESVRDFWTNGLTRVLLVTALTNLGAMVGFFLGGSFLVHQVFGIA